MTAALKLQETDLYNGLTEPRIERIFGSEYAMSSPKLKHQMTAGLIFAQLYEKISQHGCTPVIAPFDVFPLYEKGDECTVVIPDIILACDKTKLKENGYFGAPKFIAEILSTNRSHDMVTKLNLYEKAGVEEYWIVDAEEQVITVLELTAKGYITRGFSGEETVPLITIPGCSIDFKKVFE